MKFKDLYFSREDRFSVGVEEETGSYYVSIPVSNSLVDYEEYYRIDESLFQKHSKDLGQLKYVAEEARKRLRDADLFFKPGSDRGSPR